MDKAEPCPPVYDIEERTLRFAVRLIRMVRSLKGDFVGQTIARQLLRSGTSVGANVAEAQAGQSRADFIAKMSIAHKEICETEYWLRLVSEAGLTPEKRLADLKQEASEIGKVISTIVKRAKQNVNR